MEASYPGFSMKFTTAQIPIEFTSSPSGTFPYSAIPLNFTLFFLYEQEKTTQKPQELGFLSGQTTETVSKELPCRGLAAGLLHPRAPVPSRVINDAAMLWKCALPLAYKLLPELPFSYLRHTVCDFWHLVTRGFQRRLPRSERWSP